MTYLGTTKNISLKGNRLSLYVMIPAPRKRYPVLDGYNAICSIAHCIVTGDFRSEHDARAQATSAGVSADVKLERDPDVLDTWFR